MKPFSVPANKELSERWWHGVVRPVVVFTADSIKGLWALKQLNQNNMQLNVKATLDFDFSSSVGHQILGLMLSSLSFPNIISLGMCVGITGFKQEE